MMNVESVSLTLWVFRLILLLVSLADFSASGHRTMQLILILEIISFTISILVEWN